MDIRWLCKHSTASLVPRPSQLFNTLQHWKAILLWMGLGMRLLDSLSLELLLHVDLHYTQCAAKRINYRFMLRLADISLNSLYPTVKKKISQFIGSLCWHWRHTRIIQLHTNIDLVISILAIQVSNVSDNSRMALTYQHPVTQFDWNIHICFLFCACPVSSLLEYSLAGWARAGESIIAKRRYAFITLNYYYH